MNFGGAGNNGVEFEYKHIVWALMIVILLPILMPMLVAPATPDAEWQAEVEDIQNTYYLQSGVGATSEINIWPLTGIYTPYTGGDHGYTEDGWLYGTLIKNTTPSQYSSNPYWADETFTASRASNGLYYYTSAPNNSPDIVANKTVYSSVTMDKEQKSSIFFTTSSRVSDGDHYYYAYEGYRYSFSPLSNYTTTANGATYEVNASTTSCSLIWYEYQTIDGIAGQLTISARDYGVSYLGSDDIIAAYDSANYSARFDMQFGNIPMHLLIRLNPTAVASGLSIPDIWNGGYWSVMVYSDQDATGATLSQTWEFNPDRILETVIDLFTFDIAKDYQLDGWEATLASMIFTLAMYAALIAIALNHAYLWILVAAIAAIQSMKFW